MSNEAIRQAIQAGKTSLGVEFGSTRIKAVLIGDDSAVLAQGNHDWENRLENNIWTYTLDDIWTGIQDSYQLLREDVRARYDVELETIGSIGISAMMHGYMAFDADDKLLVPFRTWRNTITAQAAAELTELFNFNIPQRWSIAHLEQAILNGEEHVSQIRFLTTLAGYVHWMLTGEKTLGTGEGSGMFPLDSATNYYDEGMLAKYNALLSERGLPWKLQDILPRVQTAGEQAGVLTEAGAKLLDVSGTLKPGIPFCPPEGDAETGMIATNSIVERTGNVSAGTSIFGEVVLERPLSKPYPEIDIVATPTGKSVAMVHCNNCTSDLNAWMGLFREFSQLFGLDLSNDELFSKLFIKSLEGEKDCGGLLSYNFISGEPVVGFKDGRPVYTRTPDSHMNLANFMRVHLYSLLASLKIGMNLLHEENVQIDRMYGHGGLFKTKGVVQSYMASAIGAPVSVMETASEGGAWGIAVLAAYMRLKGEDEALDDYLNNRVFAGNLGEEIQPNAEDAAGIDRFIETFTKGFPIERAAAQSI